MLLSIKCDARLVGIIHRLGFQSHQVFLTWNISLETQNTVSGRLTLDN